MEQAVALLALGLLASKVFELIKRIKAKDSNGSISIVAVWVAGVVAIVLASHAQVFQDIVIPGTLVPMGLLDGASQVFLGLTLASFVSVTYDFKGAIDNTDSSRQPTLLDTPPNPPQG